MVGMKPSRSLILLLFLLLAGCQKPPIYNIYVAPGVPFRLCPPEAEPDFFATQEVVFGFPGGRRELVIAAIENQGGTLNLVASTPMGQTLFSVRVRSDTAAVDTRVPLPGGLDPRVLPALVQFALWPAEAVRASLGPGLRFEQDGTRRTLLRKDKVVWTVTREGAPPAFTRMVLENPALGLTLRIRTLEP
jgi:hypothetical protein